MLAKILFSLSYQINLINQFNIFDQIMMNFGYQIVMSSVAIFM